MRLFGKKTASKPVQNALLGFSARLATIEREQRSLKLEWLETYDKINRLMARLAKRDAIDKRPQDQPDPPVHNPYSHLDPISAEIMLRRAKGMNS